MNSTPFARALRWASFTFAAVLAACGGPMGPGSDSDSEGSSQAALSTPTLPARIQAEDYNAGGEGVGYHDTTVGNSGGQYRTDNVDIEVTTDTGGGYDVGWIAAGEWLAFTVNIPVANTFNLTARVSSGNAGTKTFHFELDDQPIGPSLSFTGGAGWQSWQDVTATNVSFPAGTHTLKVVFDTAKLNLNYIDVTGGRGPLVFGMYDNASVAPAAIAPTSANFRAVANTYMVGNKINVRRCFNSASSFPNTYSASDGAQDAANGNLSFLSVKPPNGDVQGVINGTYDARITTLCQSMPSNGYMTMYHEPENDMAGATFVAMFKHYYSICKAANPSLTIGYIAGSYQWTPGMASTANPDDWWMGADSTDFLAVDAYVPAWVTNKKDLSGQPDFQRWYQWALSKNKPLLITEYGIEGSNTGGLDDTARAALLTSSIEWVWNSAPMIHMMLYWHSYPPQTVSEWAFTPSGGTTWSSPLTNQAWNSEVALHGSTDTSITNW